MFGIDDFSLSLSGNGWIYFLLISLSLGFAVFVYRYTIPKIPQALKYFLTLIRTLVFSLLLFVIFEPLLSLSFSTKNPKSIFVFVDNSKSISLKDSLNRSNGINQFTSKLFSEKDIAARFFSFGKKIDSLNESNLQLRFDDNFTNYSQVEEFLRRHNNEVKFAVIISDGIITDGADPTYQFEKFQFPVFTVGVGDTTTKRDVEIFNVTHNQFIYAGAQTKIQATIKQNGFTNKLVRVSFYEEESLIESKDIQLSAVGNNIIEFSYSPKSGGEKKLNVRIATTQGEENNSNNSKTFFINVLDTKLKVGLIAGAPSADVSSIAKALESDKNLSVRKFIQISKENIWNNTKTNSLDSLAILFLVDFPSANTSSNFLNQVVDKVEKGTPFFISISSNTDFGKLKSLEKYLPFSFSNYSQDLIQVQAEIQKGEFAASFTQHGNSTNVWNNLAPVFQSTTQLSTKPESKVIVKTKVKESLLDAPLMLLRSIGNQRSFCINASNYWRWSLQTAENNPEFYKNFINEIVKWLSLANNKKQFSISSNKKIYSPNEQVELTAELYDNAFNPVDTTQIFATIINGNNKFNISFTSIENGIYSATFTPETQGDYSVQAEAKINSMVLKAENRITVNSVSPELINTRMDEAYLKQLAFSTNGEYFSIEVSNGLIEKLHQINKTKNEKVFTKKEFELWNYSWVLIVIIFLFALEWFLRKRFGMI